MEAITPLTEINWLYVCGAIVGAIIAARTITNAFEWLLIEKLGIETRATREKRKDHDLIINTMSSLNELRNHHEEDVEETNKHDQVIREELLTLTDTVNSVIQKLDEIEAKRDESERAKLKDRIAEAYRKYHTDGKWTKMDKEAYTGLIKDYENHGGKNSFVHETCEPESCTWEIID